MRTQGLRRVATEERVRPIKHTLWRPDSAGTPPKPVGVFGRQKFMDGFNPPNWESSSS
jgi:hypothetical protein